MKSILFVMFFVALNLVYAQGFIKLSAEESGVEFTNQIHEDDTLNGLSYLYLYNGGGVAIGDINNDGLEDVYFTGNQVDDKLYLNQGNMEFKDVTKKYFKKEKFDFHTGVTMVDINNDGWLDIYVSCAGPSYEMSEKRNKLYINQKGKSFVNKAQEYGLDDSTTTTQAVFFDADEDGDLDAYILNHKYDRSNAQRNFPKNKILQVKGTDRLMINENGKFIDRSVELGIKTDGVWFGYCG